MNVMVSHEQYNKINFLITFLFCVLKYNDNF